MNTNHSISQKGTQYREWRVSWIAYIPYALIACTTLYAVTLIDTFSSSLIVAGALLVLLCYVAYKVYYLTQIRLYTDDHGVWVYRGVFPWNRGVYGVKWRDFEDVVFFTGFFYWIAKGYPVTIRPRFSNNPKVSLPPIHQGREAVEAINFMAQTNEKELPR